MPTLARPHCFELLASVMSPPVADAGVDLRVGVEVDPVLGLHAGVEEDLLAAGRLRGHIDPPRDTAEVAARHHLDRAGGGLHLVREGPSAVGSRDRRTPAAALDAGGAHEAAARKQAGLRGRRREVAVVMQQRLAHAGLRRGQRRFRPLVPDRAALRLDGRDDADADHGEGSEQHEHDRGHGETSLPTRQAACGYECFPDPDHACVPLTYRPFHATPEHPSANRTGVRSSAVGRPKLGASSAQSRGRARRPALCCIRFPS